MSAAKVPKYDVEPDRLLAKLARSAARHRGATLVITVLVMGTLGSGILALEFDDNPFQSLPRDNPHTEATHRFFNTLPGGSYASAVFFTATPEKWDAANAKLPNRMPYDDNTRTFDDTFTGVLDQIVRQGSGGTSGVAHSYPGPNNITDEVYFRAHEEFWQFIKPQVPSLRWDLTISSNIKLVNYTNTGIPGIQPPDESAFSMPNTGPDGAAQYQAAWQSRYAASPATIGSLISGDWTTVRNVYLFEPEDATLNEIGAQFEDAVEAYRDALRTCDESPADCELTWNVFHPDEVVVDPRSGTAAASYLTKTSLEDLRLLAPIAAALMAGAFFLAFRRFDTVLVLAAPMSLAGIGVLGSFGLIGLPIHSVTLLVFPILMGNGIDFAFHMTAAYHAARADGADSIQAATAAGSSAGTPLFIATLTTFAGMMLLVFAPNVLLAQLGWAIIIGMGLLLVVSLTTLPAVLTWTKPSRVARESALGSALEKQARFWHRRKALGIGVIALLTAGSVLAIAQGQDVLVVGTPAAFFPEGDQQREDFEYTNEVYFGGSRDLVTNILILEGDLTRPEAHDFLEDLEATFREKPYALSESVVSINFAMKSWIQVRQGTAGAPLVIAQESAQPGSTFPDTQEGIRELLDEMFDTPLATYASFFTQPPAYNIGSMTVEMEQPHDFEDIEVLWNDLLHTIEVVGQSHPDHGLEIHVTGGTAVGYLFAAEEIPYLQTAALVGLGATVLLVLVIRRNVRDAMTVGGVVAATGIWWSGALWVLGIPLSVTLVGPIVMIAAIGSDYALHLRYGLEHEGARAWSTVGRAVFYSAVTDIAAFLVFTQMRYGVLRDATVATAVALVAALVATMIVVPLLARDQEVTHADP